MMESSQFKKEWMSHPEWWFSKQSDYDAYITLHFEHLLDIEHYDIVTQIIIYDQLPRHIYRHCLSQHIIEYYLRKAVDIAQRYINDISFLNQLSSSEWMFFMLPLRHSKDQPSIQHVMKRAWERVAWDDDKEILKKFIRATYANCPTNDQSLYIDHEVITDTTIDDYKCILDFSPKDEYKTMSMSHIGEFMHYDTDTIIVSLSGGVDSMVALMISKRLYPTKNIVAVHINYNNRKSSYLETMFVKWWCDKTNTTLYTRTIYEINRPKCMELELRELYETYTKNVRFGTYQTVWRNELGKQGKPFVMLGHNKDDCFENIMTNMTFRCKYENLAGMVDICEQQGIIFARPLLNVPKSNITAYAHENNIPYLYDSTPFNCQRGVIRSRVVPTLHSWNKECVTGMFEMASTMKDLYSVLQQTVKCFCMCFDVKYTQTLPYHMLSETCIFWKQAFINMFSVYASHKSLKSCCDKLRHYKQRFHNIELHTTYKIVITKRLLIELKKLRNENVEIRLWKN